MASAGANVLPVAATASAAATAAAVPSASSARLVMYNGASPYKLAKLYDEYAIVCLEGLAIAYERDLWWAIALEVDGKIVPFHGSEVVHMKVRLRVLASARYPCCPCSRHDGPMPRHMNGLPSCLEPSRVCVCAPTVALSICSRFCRSSTTAMQTSGPAASPRASRRRRTVTACTTSTPSTGDRCGAERTAHARI